MAKVDNQAELRERHFFHKAAVPHFNSVERHLAMYGEYTPITVAGCSMTIVADKDGRITRSTDAWMSTGRERLMCKKNRQVIVLMFCPLGEKVVLCLCKIVLLATCN